jgi:hypothetical protein
MFRLKDCDMTVKNISPFYIQRAVDSTAGKVSNASRLKNGTLLVQARNERQAEVLLKATLLGSYPMHVGRHTSLNSSRRVIHTHSLDGMSDEEIQSALADQFVSRAYRLTGKRDNRPFPLRTIFLTFEVPSPPLYLHVGYKRVPVRPYVPNPTRCHRYSEVWI